MKIVIAAWHLRDFNVGLGRYTQNLIESLGRVDQENEYEILVPVDSSSFTPRPNVHYHVCRYPVLKRRFWEQMATRLVGKYDLVHFPYDSCLAGKRGKFIVTIHDVKHLLYPKPVKRLNLARLVKRLLIPRPLKNIDHIITVSECSRRDIIAKLGVPNDLVTVIPQGVEQGKFLPLSEERSHESELRPSVLCVAGSDPTKNVHTLIRAFSLLPEKIQARCELILVGDVKKQGELHQLVKQKGLESRTRYSGVVSDQQLVCYYQQASVFVFPSLYEGFGLPVLEAMACGCPVVCSQTSSLPEVVGDAALMVDPVDAMAMKNAIERILTDPVLQRRMREAGLQRAKKFSWDHTARQTARLYERVVNA